METPACLPRRHGHPALGCRGDDAARQRGRSRRTTRGARNRIPRAGHRSAGSPGCSIAPRPAPTSLEDWQIANLREMRRQRDFAIATPVALVSRLAKAASKAEAKWLYARETGKFEDFAPHLEEVVHLVRDKAQLLGQSRNLSPYDALVDEFSPGLTSAEIDAMFKALARRLPGLIRDVLARQEQRPLLPITGKFSAAQAARAGGRDHEGRRVSVRSRPARRERTSVHRRRAGRRARHHALRYQRAVLRPAGRAARDRPRHVRRGPAGRNLPISPWAAIAAWRSKRASRCSWR